MDPDVRTLGFVSVKTQQILGGVPWNLYSIPGMALTEAVALAPIVYTFCANALRQSDASLESAAQVCGSGPLRIIFSVILPMLRPPIVYSSILVISMSVETLSVPLLYGQPVNIQVFSTFLYRNGLQSINPDYGILGAASAVILVVTISLVVLQAKLLKDSQRFVSVRGKVTRPRLLDLGWLKWISLGHRHLRRDGRNAAHRRTRLPVLHPGFQSLCSRRSRPYDRQLRPDLHLRVLHPVHQEQPHRRRRWAQCWSVSGTAGRDGCPAIVLPIQPRRRVFGAGTAGHAGHHRGYRALLGLRLRPFGSGQLIQGTLWALIIGFGLRALPSGFGSLAPSVMQIAQELDNAARVAGADWVMTFGRS